MELHTDIVGMSLEFKDFTTLPRIILTDIDESCSFDALNQVRIDLVAMTVPFIHSVTWPVQRSDLTGINLPKRWAGTQAHGATEMGLRNFRHEYDGSVSRVVFEFC